MYKEKQLDNNDIKKIYFGQNKTRWIDNDLPRIISSRLKIKQEIRERRNRDILCTVFSSFLSLYVYCIYSKLTFLSLSSIFLSPQGVNIYPERYSTSSVVLVVGIRAPNPILKISCKNRTFPDPIYALAFALLVYFVRIKVHIII